LYRQLPERIVALVNSLEPEVEAIGQLPDSAEREILIATALPVREAARAKLLVAKLRLRQRRAGDALNLLQDLPPNFQRTTVEELRRQAYRALGAVDQGEARARGRGARVAFTRQQPAGTQIYEIALLEKFFADVVTRERLPIGEVIANAESDGKPIGGKRAVFLKAATGVGKTVAAPLHIFLQLARRISGEKGWQEVRNAQVIVVEPRIAIAENEAIHLNDLFFNFLKRNGHTTAGSAGIFGSITSASGRQNGGAPIIFVTSGVFESMAQNIGKQHLGLNPEIHRVVVDEAHVTLPANPGVEIAIALCRRARVPVDYMSATVDDAGLHEMLGVEIIDATTGYVRYPIEYRPTGQSLEKCLVSLVDEYLIRRSNISAELREHDSQELPESRAIGMLVVVNSHQAENSDTLRYAKLLEEYRDSMPEARDLEIKRLASPVLRNAALRQQFEGWRNSLDQRAGGGEAPRYVIIATNVVEMGVTFASLDFVVSMDTEFVTEETVGGATLRKAPLSVSALTQRAGRSGRRRPGMCFLTREEEDVSVEESRQLSALDATSLRHALTQPERLQPSLADGNLERLALLSFKESEGVAHKWSLLEYIPSFYTHGASFVSRLENERRDLVDMGLADGQRLTVVGRSVVELVKCNDLRFAQLYATAQDSRLRLPLALIIAAGDISLSDIVHPHRMLNEDSAETSGFGRRRGARLSLDESLGDLQGPNGELLPLNVDVEQATNLLAEHGVNAISELIADGMNEVQASMAARLLGRGFDVIEWQETVGQEPSDPDVYTEWQRAAERARARIHFRRTLTLLDSESDLISIYLISQSIIKHYSSAFISTGVPSYFREKVAEQYEQDLREGELRPRELKSSILRGLELAEDLRLLRDSFAASNQLLGNDEITGAVGAAAELFILSANADASNPLPSFLFAPSVRAVSRCLLDTGRTDNTMLAGYLNEEIASAGEEVEARRLDGWIAGVLSPAEYQSRRRLRRLEVGTSSLALPILTAALRASILAHLRRPPFYGEELVLQQNGYGNYEARRNGGGETRTVELSVGRTGVRLKGEYVRIIGRLRPGVRKVANPEKGEPPLEEPILNVTHVTVLGNELSKSDALSRMEALSLAPLVRDRE
jgi:hypothetical protein